MLPAAYTGPAEHSSASAEPAAAVTAGVLALAAILSAAGFSCNLVWLTADHQLLLTGGSLAAAGINL